MHPEIRLLLWDLLARFVHALPWLLGGFGGLALLSCGPIGRALRRLARSRDEDTALLKGTAAAVAHMQRLLEEMAERQDYMERSLAQGDSSPSRLAAGAAVKAAPVPHEITPH